jgi:hypothetical protein
MRKVAVVVGVIGVGAVVGGVVMGTKSRDLQKQSDTICPTTTCNDMHALQLNSDAKSDAQLATIAYIGGGVAIAGGVVLWFLGAPKSGGEGVAIAPMVGHASGLVVTGRF